jgi:hypothetical protein
VLELLAAVVLVALGLLAVVALEVEVPDDFAELVAGVVAAVADVLVAGVAAAVDAAVVDLDVAGVVTAAGAGMAVELLVAGAAVLVVPADVDVLLVASEVVEVDAASDEPQALSAEQQARTLICKPMEIVANLDAIINAFPFCQKWPECDGTVTTRSHQQHALPGVIHAAATHRPEASRVRLAANALRTGRSKT